MFNFKTTASPPPDEIDAPPAVNPEFKAVEALAAKALLLSDTYQTPPVPKTYAVWYSYAAGVPEEVADKINGLLKKDGTVGTYELDQVHLEFLSTTEQERRHQEALGHHLDREMADIAKLVQDHLASSDSFSGSLKQTATSLTDMSTPAQVRSAIKILLRENARMREDTSKLNDSLAESRAQVRRLRASLEKSREKEMRDPMTNLANRRFFEIRFAREIAEAEAHGSPLCLVLLDIDHFKRINDTHGHIVGDDVLRYFASILMSNVKGRDLAARYGGEEFALILPSTEVAHAHTLCRQIMEQLEQSRLVLSQGKRPIGNVTASFGIAEFRAGDGSECLVTRADERLYKAKKTGRNRIVSE